MNTPTDSDLFFLARPATGPSRGLLVLLHGVGSSEQSLVSLAQDQPPDVTVLVPRGPLALGPTAFGWYQVTFGPQGPVLNAEQAEAARKILIAFIARQQEATGTVPARTIVAGFSQGGIMSAGVALTSPGSVAAFGILSGRILAEIDPLIAADVASSGLEGLVMHGRRDSVLPFAHAENSVTRLESLGVRHKLLAYDGADHGLSDTMRSDFHDWVDQQLSRAT